MKHYLFSAILVLLSVTISAQLPTDYSTDIDRLSEILKKTPSFKQQVTRERLKAYDSLCAAAKQQLAGVTNSYDAFVIMAQLFFPFRDNHLAFYQQPDYSQFKDATSIAAYKTSAGYTTFPRVAIDTDSLHKALQQKPAATVEGIYYYDSLLTVGVCKTGAHQYLGVVMATKISYWNKGDIAIYLYEYEPGLFRAIYAHPAARYFILTNNEKYSNRSLINSHFYYSFSNGNYVKDPAAVDYSLYDKRLPAFQFKTVNPQVQYIRLGHFSAMNNAMAVSQQFYEQIKDSLTAPNLVIDLRENEGGAEKVSRKFFKLVKDYAAKGKVHVLINNGTMSQGEIFTLQLKELPNTTVYGQTSRGTIAYGSNYGKREKLPISQFEIYITDMNTGGKDVLQYESYGVKPDVFLSNDKDWMEQVLFATEKR